MRDMMSIIRLCTIIICARDARAAPTETSNARRNERAGPRFGEILYVVRFFAHDQYVFIRKKTFLFYESLVLHAFVLQLVFSNFSNTFRTVAVHIAQHGISSSIRRFGSIHRHTAYTYGHVLVSFFLVILFPKIVVIDRYGR